CSRKNMTDKTSDGCWLQDYLVDAVAKNLCTKIRCTTCGALEFRRGLLKAAAKASGANNFETLDSVSASVILDSLARITAGAHRQTETEGAVRLLLFDLWNSMLLQGREHLLAGSWAGGVLEGMKAHYRAET